MKQVKCRYCRKGHVPASDGYHYIVKSVRPPRMNIELCADYVPPVHPVVPGGFPSLQSDEADETAA